MWFRAMLRGLRRPSTGNPPAGAVKAEPGGGRPEDSSTGDRKAHPWGHRLEGTYNWSSFKETSYKFSAVR